MEMQIAETVPDIKTGQDEMKNMSFLQRAMVCQLGAAIDFKNIKICQKYSLQPIAQKQSILQDKDQTLQILDIYYSRYFQKIQQEMRKRDVPLLIYDFLNNIKRFSVKYFCKIENQLLREQFEIEKQLKDKIQNAQVVSFENSIYINHFLNIHHFFTETVQYHFSLIPSYFKEYINMKNITQMSFIFRDPIKKVYEQNIPFLRKLFLTHHKKDGVVPVIGSLNPYVDQFLRCDLIHQIYMLADPKINNQLITFLRMHEILETSILLKKSIFQIDQLHKEYKLKSVLTNQQWLEYEISQLIPLNKCEYIFNARPDFFKSNFQNVTNYRDFAVFIQEFRGIKLLDLYNMAIYPNSHLNKEINQIQENRDSPRKKLWQYLRKFKLYETAIQQLLDAPKDFETSKFAKCIICLATNTDFPKEDDLIKDPLIPQRNIQFKGCSNCRATYCIVCWDADKNRQENQRPFTFLCSVCKRVMDPTLTTENQLFHGICNEYNSKTEYFASKRSFYRRTAEKIDDLHRTFVQEYEDENQIDISAFKYNRHQFVDSNETVLDEDSFVNRQYGIKDFFRKQEIHNYELGVIPKRQTQFWIPPRKDIKPTQQTKMQQKKDQILGQRESEKDSSYDPNQDANSDTDSPDESFYDRRGRRFIKAKRGSPFSQRPQQIFNVPKQRLRKIKQRNLKQRSSKKVIIQSRLSFLADEQNIIVQKENKRKMKQIQKEMDQNPLRFNQNQREKKNFIQQNLFLHKLNDESMPQLSIDEEHDQDFILLKQELLNEQLNKIDQSSEVHFEFDNGKVKKVKRIQEQNIGSEDENDQINERSAPEIKSETETEFEDEELEYEQDDFQDEDYDELDENNFVERIYSYGQDPDDQIAYHNIGQININCKNVFNQSSDKKEQKQSKRKK